MGIYTIIAVRQILSQQPLWTVTALHRLANMCGSLGQNLNVKLLSTLSIYAALIGYIAMDNVKNQGLQKVTYVIRY